MTIVAHVLPPDWAEDEDLLALLRDVITQWRSSDDGLLRLVDLVDTREGPALLAEVGPPLTFTAVLRAAHAVPVAERTPWAVARVCELAAALASVAAPHGDVRPATIGFRLDGRAKVLPPLGRVGHRRSSTRTGAGVVKVGILEWLSPEAARGAPLDGRSDVYQLGHVAYRLLGGPPAFPQKTDLDRLEAVLSGAPVPPLRSVGVNVAPELEGVVARAMVAAAGERHGTVRELADALAPFADEAAATREQIAAAARTQPIPSEGMVLGLLLGGLLRSPCARRWADLTPTADPGVRDCASCQLSVQRITSAAELIPLGGSCVFFDP